MTNHVARVHTVHDDAANHNVHYAVVEDHDEQVPPGATYTWVEYHGPYEEWLAAHLEAEAFNNPPASDPEPEDVGDTPASPETGDTAPAV